MATTPEQREKRRLYMRQLRAGAYGEQERAARRTPEAKAKRTTPEARAKRNEYQRKYRATPEYRAKRNAYEREYWAKRMQEPAYRLQKALRRRLHHALQGVCKAAPTLELLGCTTEELRLHLEAQWAEGMSWDNYGTHGWHIDHIKPCASFDLSDPAQQRTCFHYTNLQPLWARDNLAKGAT